MKPTAPLQVVAALALTAIRLPAADTLDLSRITPVEENQPVPIVDFVRRPIFWFPALNPSGTHLAALVTDTEEHAAAAAVDLKSNAIEYIKVQDTITSVNGLVWLNDTRLLAFGYGLYAGDVGKMSDTYTLLRGTSAALIGVPRNDRIHPIFWVGSGGEQGVNDTGPTRIDSSLNLGLQLVARGMDWWAESQEVNRRHILTNYPRIEGVTGAARYFSDKDGYLAYAIAGDNGFEKLYRFEDGKWLECPFDLDAYFFVGAGNEKNQVVVCPRARTGKPLPLVFANAVTGQLGDVLLQDKNYDASTASLYRDRKTGVIVGVTLSRGTRQTIWFDEGYRAVQKLIDGSFPGLRAQIVDNNEAGNLFLIATWSDREPSTYHWVDVTDHKAALVKRSQPWIDPKRRLPTNVMKYQTRDGHTVDAFVTLPAGASKANPPPLMVFPSYDPWVACLWGYDDIAQYLASRGYAVLRPNHRGANGYNWQFKDEERYDFLAMSDDIADATATLVKSGLVDAKRVGIMGSEYGAYFAAEGIVRHPELYRCAVTIDGFFDWESLMADLKYNQYASNSYAYFRRKLGDPKVEKEKYHNLSPLNFVSQARAAVFISHDKADSDVYRAQSKRLLSEVERLNLPHDSYFAPEVVVDKDRLAHQVELYTRIEAFLAKNLMAK